MGSEVVRAMAAISFKYLVLTWLCGACMELESILNTFWLVHNDESTEYAYTTFAKINTH
jgi:hypothetical protein